MNFRNDIKTHAADMLKRVNETQNPIIISQNGEAKAVLLDTESYQDMINSIGILKLISQSENDFSKDESFDNEFVFNDLMASIEND